MKLLQSKPGLSPDLTSKAAPRAAGSTMERALLAGVRAGRSGASSVGAARGYEEQARALTPEVAGAKLAPKIDVPAVADAVCRLVESDARSQPAAKRSVADNTKIKAALGGTHRAAGTGYKADTDKGMSKDRSRRSKTSASVGVKHDWLSNDTSLLRRGDEKNHNDYGNLEYGFSSGFTATKKGSKTEYDLNVISAEFEAGVFEAEREGEWDTVGGSEVGGKLDADLLNVEVDLDAGLTYSKSDGLKGEVEAAIGANLAAIEAEGYATFAIPYTGKEIVIGLGAQGTAGVSGSVEGDIKLGGGEFMFHGSAKGALGVGGGLSLTLGLRPDEDAIPKAAAGKAGKRTARR